MGRASERAQLTALWRAAERGNAQLVLLTGEPGIGKTRLVEELQRWCAHAGVVTAVARAYAAEGSVAYGPVASWLRADPIATRLRRLHPVHLTELGRLLPELYADQPELPRPVPLPEDEQRQRLFAALVEALLAHRAPLLSSPTTCSGSIARRCNSSTTSSAPSQRRLSSSLPPRDERSSMPSIPSASW